MKPHLLSFLIALAALGLPQVSRGDLPPDPAASTAQEKAKDQKPDKSEKPERPDKNDSKSKPDKVAIDALKDDFRSKASEYQKKQKDLLDQLKHANSEERAKIREALKELKDQWNDFRGEFKDKLPELRPKIDKDAIDDAKRGGKPRK